MAVSEMMLKHTLLQSEYDKLKAVKADLLSALKYAESMLWDTLGGDDDPANAESANTILKPIRAAIAKAE